jgi:hypothetical protein
MSKRPKAALALGSSDPSIMQNKTEWLIIGIAVFVMLFYLFSLWPGQDAVLATLGMCLKGATMLPNEPVITQASDVYICGSIVGATTMQASIRLYRGDEFIDSWSGKLRPGQFLVPIADDSSLTPGTYVARVVSGRQLMGQTEFQITE